MADADSEWCIFPNGDEAAEDDEGSDDDGSDDEDDDDDFLLIKCHRSGDGIRSKEFKKKKKAAKKHSKLEGKGDMNIVVKGGELFKCSDPQDDTQRAQVCFLIGYAFGKDLLSEENLGPLVEDGHELEILEDTDPDEDSDED